ncbi:MAG TPA: AarF/UbiB family protein [Gemmatimonadales bacterium]|jgi:predicted unusual protein kinase regulating ubiquinone biosynthesis (AarF/ABC1/UbiB family)
MRPLVVFIRLVPFVLAFLRDRRRYLVFGRPLRRNEERHRKRAERLTRTVADLGPAFIKLAQVFAARADILPEPYLSSIGTLTDQVPPLPAGAAESVIRSELGDDAARIFERFDPEPLAAASLGQVHRAAYQGREVVVKVLRPGVEEVVRRDLDVSFRILFLLNLLFPGHQVRAITAIVSEFSKRISDELDFREEARNAETLKRNFAGESKVVVPGVVSDLVRRRVLVLEYVEGTRIDRLHQRLASGELRLDALMAMLAELYMKMMLEDGVFHADPHAGNLLVDQEGRLVLLDFGMVLQVERETRRRLVEAVLAAARQDVDGLINAFYELGILDPDVDRGTIRDAARSLMAITIRNDVTSRQIQRLVEQVLHTFYEWPLMLPSNLVYFGRAAVLVEGIGLRYDPEFNALAVARPVVTRSAGRLMQGVLEQDPRLRITDWTQEALTTVRTLRDLVRRVERDELRVRWHPRDSLELQRFLAQQVRRALLALFAFTLALITSVVYLATGRLAVLALGLALSFGMFLVIFLLPTHLFQNPLRFRRRWPGR